jgi:hypothetical protein
MTVALIRTKGCQGCNIMVDILMQVVKAYAGSSGISFLIFDKTNVPNVILQYLGIKDFPTLVITSFERIVFDEEVVNCTLPKCKGDYFTILEGTQRYVDVTAAIEKYR